MTEETSEDRRYFGAGNTQPGDSPPGGGPPKGGFTIKKRSETEQVAYLVGKYFTGEITLKYLKIQIQNIPEPFTTNTTT